MTLKKEFDHIVTVPGWRRGHDCLILEAEKLTEESYLWIRKTLGEEAEALLRSLTGTVAVCGERDFRTLQDYDPLTGPPVHRLNA